MSISEIQFALPPGTVITGYEIVRALGAGGFGITYEGFNPITERRVAIKEFFPRGMASREGATKIVFSRTDAEIASWALRRFEESTKALAKLEHDNIVEVLNYVSDHGTGYMVMEHVDGETLERWLKARRGPPTLDDIRPFLAPVFDALEYVHMRNILHRDIAPDNVMIAKDGRPVLIDFGAIKVIEEQTRAKSGTSFPVGKRFYSPPEQFTSSSVDARTDIYALAAVLYRALTGSPPVDSDQRKSEIVDGKPDSYVPVRETPTGRDVPEDIASAIDRALSIRRDLRPASIAEFRDLIGWSKHKKSVDLPRTSFTPVQAADDANVVASAPSAALAGTSAASRKEDDEDIRKVPRPWLGYAGGALAVLVVGAAFVGSLWRDERVSPPQLQQQTQKQTTPPSQQPQQPKQQTQPQQPPQQQTTPPDLTKRTVWIGVRVATADEKNSPDAPRGALVLEVTANGPAANGGILNGDVLTRINGREIVQSRDIATALENVQPGTNIEIELYRTTERRSLRATLRAAAPPAQQPQSPPQQQQQTTPPPQQPAMPQSESQAFAAYQRALAARERNDADTALAEANEAIRLDPTYTLAYLVKAQALYRKQRYNESHDALDVASRRGLDSAELFNVRGLLHHAQRSFSEAIVSFNEAVKRASTNAVYYANRGLSYSRLDNLESALADFNEAVRLAPQRHDFIAGRADVYYARHDYRLALSDYNTSLRINPKSANVLTQRGWAHFRLNDRRSALADANAALNVNANYAGGYNLRGTLFATNGEFDRAINDFSSAIRLNTSWAVAYANRGLAYYRKQDLANAEKDVNEAIRLDPRNALAHQTRGYVYQARGQRDLAIEAFRTALQLDRTLDESRKRLQQLGVTP